MTDILLVDLSSVLHPIWHMETANPDPNATSTKTVARVRALASGQPHVAVCIDSPKSFRKELDPTYKAQREANAPLVHQMKLAIETLRADGFPVWGAEGFEADDVIASSALAASGKDGDWRVVIASADKDLLQLVGDAVVVKSLKDGSELGAADVHAKFGVEPTQIRDFLTMVGDTADNVTGIPGVGPKFAASFLQEFKTLDLIYDAIDKGITPTLTPVQRTKFQAFRAQLPITRSLIQLRYDVPIPFDEIFKPRHPASVNPLWDETRDDGYTQTYIPDGTEQINTTTGEVTMLTIDDVAKATAEVGARLAADIKKDVAEMMQDRPAITQAPPPRSSAPATPATPATPAKSDVEFTPQSGVHMVRAPQVVDYERQLEPTSLSEAHKLAMSMFQSRLFSAYGSADGVFATILAGREYGMAAMASLRAFHIIEGKPTLAADTIRALILKSGAAEYFRCVERTPTRATFATKRKGEPEMTLTYTIEEGRAAFNGDDKKWAASGWGKNGADMCVARAGAKLARLVYPDVCHGIYAPEEF